MTCKICKGASSHSFRTTLLSNVVVDYFLCPSCGFLQTCEPNWLERAYEKALSSLDTSLLNRPLSLRVPTAKLILKYLDSNGRFLDFGGGSGVFARMMRDLGFDFFLFDKFAENLFCQGFDLKSLPENQKNFELITFFEVAEHLPDPMEVFEELFQLSDTLLFSTELIPSKDPEVLKSWEYLGIEHGQHISFYEKRTLDWIAKRFQAHHYPCSNYLHVLTRKSFHPDLSPPFGENQVIIRKIRQALSWILKDENYWLSLRKKEIGDQIRKTFQP